MQLLPSHDAVSLITVLPEQLQSPLLTAEWEYRLGEIERGQLAPEEFLDGISTMLKDLVGTYQVIKGTEYLFTPPREVVGKCPRCGGEVAELQKGFFCQNKDCKFAIWKNNKWWAAKKKQPTKAVVSALLKDGRVRVTGYIRRKLERPTMPLWFWRMMDSTLTSSWNLTSGKEAADEALFSGTGNHSPL